MLKTRLQIKQAPVYDFISVINYVRRPRADAVGFDWFQFNLYL